MRPYHEDVDSGITIYHGDNAAVLPTIDPATVGLLLTDPPYGINLDTANESRGRSNGHRKHVRSLDHPPVAGDDAHFDPIDLLRYRRVVLFGANNFAHRLPPSPSWVVWDRQSGGSDTADAELAWTNLGGTVRTFRHTWNGVCRDSEIGYHVHPTQKPAALMRWIVARWTKPGDLVLDPYMGSGPIAQACYDLGRRYIGIELVEAYCAVAVRRLGQGVLDFEGAS